jgi:hypothetical protein
VQVEVGSRVEVEVQVGAGVEVGLVHTVGVGFGIAVAGPIGAVQPCFQIANLPGCIVWRDGDLRVEELGWAELVIYTVESLL